MTIRMETNLPQRHPIYRGLNNARPDIARPSRLRLFHTSRAIRWWSVHNLFSRKARY